ncbi:MAG: Crp/Fnr family transcriptional regulator [Dysgonamonadaceae bacterium]|jgi:CRP-like cAMP-binding protein|nr:Crp/Fnr family transcriptional regulator [Dysgonamonadaceae bacterium]MDD4247264.1 Crp/Fnr family transcriptional regulator [Dysgonamonadaceae bacterium]MDD4606133.1 Crp/Fnr family transcriptional regulator [Dysgonamonadaceae bacterium]
MNKSFIFKCPLCNSIPEPEKDNFLNDVRFSLKTFKKDDWIISQGEEYTSLYILIEGEIKTVMVGEKGDFMHIENIKAPLPMATGFLFAGNNKSPVSAIAIKDCKLISIPKENVFYLMRTYDAFMHAILRSISNKVQFLSEKIRLTSLRTIKAKLAYYILKESEGESSFQLKTSKQEVANLFGVSRQALTNVMNQLHNENIIHAERRKIKIVNRQALKTLF